MREQSTRENKISCSSLSGRHEEGPRRVSRTSACSLAEGCRAPLCPLTPTGVWFADEPVCRSRKHGAGVPWVKVQRRIARLVAAEGCFTVSDLEEVRKVRRGIHGRNPDAPSGRLGNGRAPRQRPSRGGVIRTCARSLDSEPRTVTSRVADTVLSPAQSAGSTHGIDIA